MLYKITATVIRPGGLPVEWVRFSESEMTKEQCEKLLFKPREAGKSFGEQAMLENFSCARVKDRI